MEKSFNYSDGFDILKADAVGVWYGPTDLLMGYSSA